MAMPPKPTQAEIVFVLMLAACMALCCVQLVQQSLVGN